VKTGSRSAGDDAPHAPLGRKRPSRTDAAMAGKKSDNPEDPSVPQSAVVLYQAEDGATRVQCRFEGESIWLTQAMLAELFQKDVRTINEHLANI